MTTKHYLYLLAAVAGLFLGGCSEETIQGDSPTPQDGAAHLRIAFQTGATGTRAVGDPFAAELAEKTINRLSFYIYPAKEADAEAVPFQRYVFDTGTLPLEKDSVRIALAGADASDGYTCDFIVREGGGYECIVVAIANAPDNFDQTNNLNTYAKLQQAYIDCATMPNVAAANPATDTRSDKYGLIMYAEEKRMLRKSAITDVAFRMERLAARIDISNAAYTEDAAKGFVLQSARVVNAKHTSYVIPALAEPWTHPGLPTDFEAITSDAVPAAFRLATKDGTIGNGNTTDANGNAILTDATMEAGKTEQRLWHELYTYENDDPSAATATTIEIKGTFRGSPFSRILPFVDKDKNPVMIERNHRYLVRLNPAPGLTDITYNITVAEWNAADTINVKPTQKERPVLTFTPSYTPTETKTIELYKDAASFTFEASSPFDTQLKVVPETGDPIDTDVSWLTYTASEAVEVATRAEPAGYKRTYTISSAALPGNTTERRAMLLIANGANATARDTLHIKQTIYYPGTTLKPVVCKSICWAPVNVGATVDLTTVAEITETNVLRKDTIGYGFQWGRNVPFEGGKVYEKGVSSSDIANYPLYEEACFNTGTYANKYLGGASGAGNWFRDYKEGSTYGLAPMLQQSSNTWPRVCQPCPAGWRVPTKEECEKLVPSSPNPKMENGMATITADNGSDKLILPGTIMHPSSGNISLIATQIWTSTRDASDLHVRAYNLVIFAQNAQAESAIRREYTGIYYFHVRCVKE